MTEYNYQHYENDILQEKVETNSYEIDVVKLKKLDKLLVKIDNDLKKRQKDITKAVLVETLKKTHEIYQIVLYEVSEMLESAKLPDLRQILTKIYNGQNNILNYILKLNTNFEVSADQMLTNLSKNIVQVGRRKSFGSKDIEEVQNQKVASQIVNVQPVLKKIIKKLFIDQATDTGDDMKDARDVNFLAQKEKEMNDMVLEIDVEGKQIDEYLKSKKAEMMAIGESQAQNNLRDVLKDLGKKRREADQVEDDANNLSDLQNTQKNQLNAMQGSLIEGIKHMQKSAQDKALEQVKNGQALYKNGQLVYLENVGVCTDMNYFESEIKDRYEKLKRSSNDKDQKFLENEKKIKELNLQKEVYIHQIQELTQKLNNNVLTLEKRKKEDKPQDRKKTDSSSLSKQDSENIKKLVEDNISKMKLRIRTLLDNVKDLESEINRNFEKFRVFIVSSNIPEEIKKNLLYQIETLKPNLTSTNKLNLNDLKDLVSNESELYKDTLIKNIIGSDMIQLTRQVKRDEQIRKGKIAKITGYDPEFDRTNLDQDLQIIIRKVKKVVERKNSRGEWVYDDIEVDEEVVVNSKTGEELRRREKPLPSVIQSQQIKNFLDVHGGFAIGGSTITLPKRPIAKDGHTVKIGQWFEDKDGKKVRILAGKDGEEVFEIEDNFIDEHGIKQTRIKKLLVKRDKNGNEVIEEEIVGKDGKKLQSHKRIIKEKDGTNTTEEVMIDEKGMKTIKRQRVIKDKDGNDVIVEELIDHHGNKTTIKRKVLKDASGQEVVIEEKTEANGNKITTTIRKDQNGQEVIQQEIVDKHGNLKRMETKVFHDDEGNTMVEEVTFDHQGRKVTKNTKIFSDTDGNQIMEEEIIGIDGLKRTKIVKKTKNPDGSETTEEEYLDEKGNIIKVKKRVFRDKDGNLITEVEKIDSKTGTKTITKTKLDANGREQVEEQVTDKNGVIVKNSSKTVSKDKDGNIVENQSSVNQYGKKIQIQKKVYKDKEGREVTEEIQTDDKGNQKTVRTKVVKDKDGNDVIEETMNNADGSKTVIRKRAYFDKDGNEVTEEEQTDTKGNKVVIKTKIGRNGEITIEETRTGSDGKTIKTIKFIRFDQDGNQVIEQTTIGWDGKTVKTIKTIKLDANGNQVVEQITIGEDGNKVVKVYRSGHDEKTTQTQQTQEVELTVDQLLEKLITLGADKSKVDLLRKDIFLRSKYKDKSKKNEEQIEEQKEEQVGARNNSADSSESLELLDEDNETDNDQAAKLYNKMMQNKFGGMADLIRQVELLNVWILGNEKISQEEFSDYLQKMKQVHTKCGEHCPHLKKFYEKLGFVQKKYKRRFLRMKDTRIEAKKKLPQIQTPQKI